MIFSKEILKSMHKILYKIQRSFMFFCHFLRSRKHAKKHDDPPGNGDYERGAKKRVFSIFFDHVPLQKMKKSSET